MLKYTYKEKQYDSLYQIRKEFPNLVFSDTEDSFSLLGIKQITIPPLPPDIETVRKRKMSEVERLSAKFEQNLNKDMWFTSSIKFKCNGDRRTKANLGDLYQFFDLQAQDGHIQYRDYDNELRALTKEQVHTLLLEHVVNGQSLYEQKWALQERIKAAKSIDELNGIQVEFVMQDFTRPHA